MSPAEKARIFRNGINSRNKIGWIFYDQSLRTNQITCGKQGLEQVRGLFELNRGLTPADLLNVIDAGMKVFCSKPPSNDPAKPDYWNFKRFTSIGHFANAFDKVIERLKMEHLFEDLIFLSEQGKDSEVKLSVVTKEPDHVVKCVAPRYIAPGLPIEGARTLGFFTVT